MLTLTVVSMGSRKPSLMVLVGTSVALSAIWAGYRGNRSRYCMALGWGFVAGMTPWLAVVARDYDPTRVSHCGTALGIMMLVLPWIGATTAVVTAVVAAVMRGVAGLVRQQAERR